MCFSIATSVCSPLAPYCYVMSLYFLTTDQWVPSVRSNDTREWNKIDAAATYRIASPPLVSENEAPCPFATRQWRQARTWQDAPLPPRRLVGFCSIHRALYPRALATVSATRRGACACLCVMCAGRCVGRGVLAAPLCHRVSCAAVVFACVWFIAHAVCCLLPLFLSLPSVLWPRCVPPGPLCALRCLPVVVLASHTPRCQIC